MRFNIFKNTVFPIIIGFVLVMISCGNVKKTEAGKAMKDINTSDKLLRPALNDSTLVVGANRTALYLPILKEKRVGVVALLEQIERHFIYQF